MAFKMKYKGSSPYTQKKEGYKDLVDKDEKRFGPTDDEDWTPPQPKPGKLRIDRDDKKDEPWSGKKYDK